MYPILLQLGPIKLYTYGLMMAIGFLTAIAWAGKRAKTYGMTEQFMSNISMICIIGGVVGGRVAFLLIEEDPSDIFTAKLFEVWKGGMVFYGGFIGAVLGSMIYSRMKKYSFLSVADVSSPALAFGHFFGRIGCFFAGCCYGKQCDLPWAITFTNPVSLAPLNIPLHPTELYEALGNLIIIGILLIVEKYTRGFRGRLFAIYLALYAVLRTTVEQFRGDESRGFVTFGGAYPNEWLSTSVFIGGMMILVAIGIFAWSQKSRTA